MGNEHQLADAMVAQHLRHRLADGLVQELEQPPERGANCCFVGRLFERKKKPALATIIRSHQVFGEQRLREIGTQDGVETGGPVAHHQRRHQPGPGDAQGQHGLSIAQPAPDVGDARRAPRLGGECRGDLAVLLLELRLW